MKTLVKGLEKIFKQEFNYLELNYGFKIIEVELEDWSLIITYKNSTTAIKLNYQVREAALSIILFELVNNEICAIPHPYEIQSHEKLYYSDLNLILNIREPEIRTSSLYFFKAYDARISKDVQYIRTYANYLKKYADDVLNGDFSVFKETEKEIRRRATFWRD